MDHDIHGENKSQGSRTYKSIKAKSHPLTTPPALPSPSLWQKSDRTITVLDIPESISHAQEHASHRHLLSTPPLLTSCPTNEPKSAKAKAKLTRNTVDAELHVEYARVLEQALQDARSNHNGAWCLARPFCEESTRAAKKRKLDSNPEPQLAIETKASRPSQISSAIPRFNRAENASFSNNKDEMIQLQIQSEPHEESRTFFIPPRSSFYLGDCTDSLAFHKAVRNRANKANIRANFDFILLDPPWPNRSVKRTHQTPGSTYTTAATLLDIRELILDTRLDSLMSEDCLVGIWITNKPAVRELVLGEDGVFTHWGLELFEEWIWLKTTLRGEPVTPLGALWRKPYEVLLLGRKQKKSVFSVTLQQNSAEVAPSVRRRVIIAVPDLHSRKPCLKELIEPLLAEERSDNKALEVFARHLVAGWWSWGDECIKFNDEECWKEAFDEDKEKAVGTAEGEK